MQNPSRHDAACPEIDSAASNVPLAAADLAAGQPNVLILFAPFVKGPAVKELDWAPTDVWLKPQAAVRQWKEFVQKRHSISNPAGSSPSRSPKQHDRST
jgi:hypothetical protein